MYNEPEIFSLSFVLLFRQLTPMYANKPGKVVPISILLRGPAIYLGLQG